jgi:site-specific DNA-methyltransferase (adenine-specific)
MSLSPYYSDEAVTIYHGDCREILPTLEPVDLVLTDPPYGLGDKWRGKADHVWKLDRESVLDWDGQTSDAVLGLPGLGRNCIVWGGNYYALPPVRGWLAWDKMQRHSGSDFESAWTNLDIPARTFRMCRAQAYTNGKDHPTQKPIELFRWCIGLVGPSAQTILDPFMGSGTTLRAAKDLGRRAIGIEIKERYCEIAAKRLAQGSLFQPQADIYQPQTRSMWEVDESA